MAVSSQPRVRVDGKFFRVGEKKFYARGVTYGPFAPDGAGHGLPSPEQSAKDFVQIRQLGANLIRVYETPPLWLLNMAEEHELKVLVDIPWNKHLCFLDSVQAQAEALARVQQAVSACQAHPAVFAFSIANEIPADVVRWSGARPVAEFLDLLIAEAKRVDPGCLCTYTNFPPTEYLRPRNVDFVCFNVYLHHQNAFRDYLSRLQMQADSKPLLLGELGVDSLREGEARKCALLSWQIEETFRGGLAGVLVFSFTDDWWRNERRVEDWQLGLTTVSRQAKPSFETVRQAYQLAPRFALPSTPKVSVVVAAYNAARTLHVCLESLERLQYPEFEILLVDDGSTDATLSIAEGHPRARLLRHPTNQGLSAARNTGIAAASGSIVAFTDADCRADEDWLYYLVAELLRNGYGAVGGPNLLPPEDSPVAAAVMASPGGPAAVMLTDRQAEHIPGCNMAFFKTVLEQLGGFDPAFRKAGDDVDLCWRLQQAGYRIGFSPAAFVWHFRRSTVQAYLQQQRGYGEAEALLARKHPEYFNSLGGSLWRGRIYAAAPVAPLLRSEVIYHGLFGSAGFQFLYGAEPSLALMLCTTFQYYILVVLPLWVLSALLHWLVPVALASLALPAVICGLAGAQAPLPADRQRPWSRALIGLLFLLQPLVRGWARYRQRLSPPTSGLPPQPSLESAGLCQSEQSLREVDYWSSGPLDRLALLENLRQRMAQRGWPHQADLGWSDFDLEVDDMRWSKVQLATVLEDHPGGKQLLRCRLRPRWALRTRAAFCGLAALLLVIPGLAGGHPLWLWGLLLVLPGLVYLLRRQQRELQSVLVVFLDEAAKERQLTKLPPASGLTDSHR